MSSSQSELEDMRQEIVEDAQRLAGVGVEAVEIEVNSETSDNDSINKEKKDKRGAAEVMQS